MVVSVNLAAYAIAQLVHGPLADAFGRKRLLVTSFSLFAVVSAVCALATQMEVLLAGRFLQGLLSSVPSVVIILLIRELYDEQRALRVMALYGATLGLAPAIGPLLGGYLHVWFGWQAGFLLIASLAVLVLLLVPSLIAIQYDLRRRRLALKRALRIRVRAVRAGVVLALVATLGWLGATMGLTLVTGALPHPFLAALPALAGLPPLAAAFALYVAGAAALVVLFLVLAALWRLLRRPQPAAQP
jgi:multidrug resistance protein